MDRWRIHDREGNEGQQHRRAFCLQQMLLSTYSRISLKEEICFCAIFLCAEMPMHVS